MAPKPAKTYQGRPNIFLRAIKIALITAILIAVPVAAMYVAFHLAQGTPVWPLDVSW